MKRFYLIAICLTASILYAEQKATVSFRDFTGGLNDTIPSIYLQPNESPNAQNVVFDEFPGQLQKRGGAKEIGRIPATSTGTFIMSLKRADGSEYLIARDSATLYSTKDGVNYTILKGDLNPSFSLDCEIIYNDVWCVDGSTWVIKATTGNAILLDGSPSGEARPPIAKYIEFENDIVWLANSTGSKSGVFFSRLTNDQGFLIRPDSTTAWLFDNEIRVSPDDGDIIYGIKRFRGDIYAFKSKSIHGIFGGDEKYETQRIIGNVGTRFNNAIIEDDAGLLNFMGNDAFYVFDGVNIRRTSDKIKNNFSTIFQPTVNQSQKLWTTETDWNNGSFLSDTTSSRTVGNLEILETRFLDGFEDNNYTTSPSWVLLKGTMTIYNSSMTIGGTFGNDANLISLSTGPSLVSTGTWKFDFRMPTTTISSGHLAASYIGFFANGKNAYNLQINNTFAGGLTLALTADTNMGSALGTQNCRQNQGVIVNTFSISRDTEIHHVEIERNANSSFNLYLDSQLKGSGSSSYLSGFSSMSICMESDGPSTVQDDFPYLDNFEIPVASGVYQSEVFDTGGNIGEWGAFETNENRGEGTINYLYRAGPASDLTSHPWGVISPGVRIDTATTNRYIQWLATFTAINPIVLNYPNLERLTINWSVAGDSVRSPVAHLWKRKYMVSVSTTGTSNNRVIFVRSESDINSWMKYTGWDIRGFTHYDDKLYAVDSSTNKIVQLDVGDNDYGGGIDAFWQTKDEVFGSPSHKKRLIEIGADFESTGNFNLSVDVSTNTGISFSTKTASLNGQGRNIERITTSGFNGYQYRFKIGNSEAGQQMKVYGIEADVDIGNIR